MKAKQFNYSKTPFVKKAEEFAVDAHASTNHFYDDYLPYSFHLGMVAKAGSDFLHLVSNEMKEIVLAACWTHDTIEDVRQTYNDVLNATGSVEVAEITRAVTNYGRGRNRDERMPDFVYQDIRETPGATFVKLCDRIANLQYSKLTGSSMFKKYKKEHTHFKEKLYVEGQLQEMWDYIDEILNTEK
jgi:(p)ppGpp synthase/HD superfamily hydrolase